MEFIEKAIDSYELWRLNNMFKIAVGDNDEIAVVSGKAYHTTIPTTMFNYCIMKLIMIAIGTTVEELSIFEGQFYSTRELTGARD